MMIARMLLIVPIVLLVTAGVETAWGQGLQRYQPSRPVVSPYLNFFRRDSGVLPNYWQFVQPSLQIQDTFERQGTELRVQQSEISDLRERAITIQRSPSTRRHATGSFQNYSHFYPEPRITNRRFGG